MLDPITQALYSPFPSLSQPKASGQRQKPPLHHPLHWSPSITHPLIQWPTLHPSGRTEAPGAALTKQVSLSFLCPQPHPLVACLTKGNSEGDRTHISVSQERERGDVLEHLSGLVGEVGQERGGRKREPGPERETERETRGRQTWKPRQTDKPAQAESTGSSQGL